jgi:hypothetical protein
MLKKKRSASSQAAAAPARVLAGTGAAPPLARLKMQAITQNQTTKQTIKTPRPRSRLWLRRTKEFQ